MPRHEYIKYINIFAMLSISGFENDSARHFTRSDYYYFMIQSVVSCFFAFLFVFLSLSTQ